MREVMTQQPYSPAASDATTAVPCVGAFTLTVEPVLGDNPAGVIELTDRELREGLHALNICSEYASISTTWCDNPKVC